MFCRGKVIDLQSRTRVMGVLNVTPDSFSDGGMFLDPQSAVNHAHLMASDGADIIDIGGMSTRPGSEPVSVKDEIARTAPVIRAIATEAGVPVSIDTCRSEVARAALEAGASIINDISGLRFDPAMAGLAAEYGAPVVIMHIKGTPRDMQQNPVYDALIPEIMDYLRVSIRIAEDAGVRDIVIDPGIGFGKTFEHNLSIINNIQEFVAMGHPVLIGPSRKAFLGAILGGSPPRERLEGTIASVVAAVLKGVSIVRVHDVREVSRAVRVADAIRKESMPSD